MKPTKGVLRGVRFAPAALEGPADEGSPGGTVGCQLWLAPGYLLAEEFVHVLDQALEHSWCKNVNRVIFRDIAQLPSQYPLMAAQLREDITLFRVVIELCRTRHKDCMFVCGTDEPVSRRIGSTLAGISHFTYRTRRLKETSDCELELGGRLFSAGSRRKWRLSMNREREPKHLEATAFDTGEP